MGGEQSSIGLDLARFEALTFDCYGTLIDWEAGIGAGLERVLSAHAVSVPRERILEVYAEAEAEAERGAYLRYRDVLARSLRDVCARFGAEPSEEEVAAFSGSVGEWPEFPDSRDALARLASRYRLGVITNCDDDLFALSAERLSVAFDCVVTAEQVGSYKPDQRNFLVALDRIGLPPERVLHVAQSLYHDHVPAKQLGLTTVWVDRRHDRTGFGATPPASASPDLTVPDLAALASIAEALPPRDR